MINLVLQTFEFVHSTLSLIYNTLKNFSSVPLEKFFVLSQSCRVIYEYFVVIALKRRGIAEWRANKMATNESSL